MPTFCRHNRFIERCPICRESVPGLAAPSRSSGARSRSGGTDSRSSGTDSRSSGAGSRSTEAGRRRRQGTPAGRSRSGDRARSAGAGEGLRVYSDGSRRGIEDGYSNALVPGLRSSQDAQRLAEEIGFAAGRIVEIATAPEGMHAHIRELGRRGELERASWLCMLIAYLCPLQGDQPFATIQQLPEIGEIPDGDGTSRLDPKMLDGVLLGPRTSHSPEQGLSTLSAYLDWVRRAGSQREALIGDPSWSPQRRFQRIFERLSLPGLTRAARYEMLLLLGGLGLYQMQADSLQLATAAAASSRPVRGAKQALGEPVLDAAKRVFGIGDTFNLERRASALADACGAPIEALDLALCNWAASERATLGVDSHVCDEQALASTLSALSL